MLTSPRSPRVRAVAGLKQRSARAESGLFVLEGPQAIGEAIAAEAAIEELFFTAEAASRYPELVESVEKCEEVSEEALARMADTRAPAGLVATARQFPQNLERMLEGADRVVILHEVNDPGNLGTIVRVADAAGYDAIVVTASSVDIYNPKVVRATTGSLFHIPHAVEVETERALAAARVHGMPVLAADVQGRDLREAGELLSGPHAWLFGNEARGLPEEIRALADASLTVPILGKAESLNLAAAAAVCLYQGAFTRESGPAARD